ncbi:MAG: hypothetical protein WC292_01055 [Clostridia bacterium]
MLKNLIYMLGSTAAMECEGVRDVLYPYGDEIPGEFTVIFENGESVTVKFITN